jgi:hypothetical protein
LLYGPIGKEIGVSAPPEQLEQIATELKKMRVFAEL